MLLAIAGYIVLILAAALCAYLSIRDEIKKTILDSDRDRYVDTVWRFESFNRSLLLNLLLGAVGICCTVIPNEHLTVLAFAIALAVANIIVAVLVADALRDDYRRLEDGKRYTCVKWWRTLTGALVGITIVLALIRFSAASAATAPGVPASQNTISEK